MLANGQEQKFALPIDGDCSARIWRAVATGPNLAVPQPHRLSADSPFRPSELGSTRRVRGPEVWAQFLFEPQQIRMFPNVTDDVVRHHGFYAIGQIAGHSWPPPRNR